MSKSKVKKESKLKKKINEMRQTSKGKAILKLVGWAIFFFILFIFLAKSSMLPQAETEKNNIKVPLNNSDDTNKKVDNKDILKKVQNDLLTKNYDYTYEIKINEDKYTYEGNKKNNIDKGYKTNMSEIIKYYIDDTGVYRDLGNEKIMIDNLYQEINSNYVNLEYILSKSEDEALKQNDFDGDYIFTANDSAYMLYEINGKQD